MCVAAVAWNAHPDWRLVIASNRDEFHERPSAPLSEWPDDPQVLAGHDLRGGGTWLGISRQGRAALITNFRVAEGPQPGRPSRGDLVLDWLKQGALPDVERLTRFNPFNLFVADADGARLISNHPDFASTPLTPGIHGLSNGSIAAPWPKTRQLCSALEAWLSAGEHDVEPLFLALRHETPAPPATWLPGQPEPRLSPIFIRDAIYGTRCSTVVAIDRDGTGVIIERSFDPAGDVSEEVRLQVDSLPETYTAIVTVIQGEAH